MEEGGRWGGDWKFSYVTVVLPLLNTKTTGGRYVH